MIFVTVGSMFPFDRLIRAMDAWTAKRGRDDVFAQIGDGSYQPAHMKWIRRLDQTEFSETVQSAVLIVAHAGMGSVITAQEFGKPIVLLPRIEALREHNTDHQIATTNWLRGKPGIYVADIDDDLDLKIQEALEANQKSFEKLTGTAPPDFVARIRAAILE
jgi:UDP-N-acetylglucosamine transferase subunit ALG13